MVRYYDVAAAALTLGVPHKWLDNLLSRHHVDGVERSHQGIARKLSFAAIIRLEITKILSEDLQLPLGRALGIARQVTTGGDATVTLSEGAVQLSASLPLIEKRIAARLADAVESAPRPARGRPPGTGRRTTSG